jgi:methylmalonyl-CoA/ethylmalonyl-CoA epimerase
MIKNLDHVGIVVNDLDETMKIYDAMLGAEPVSKMEMGPMRKADYRVGGSLLEFFHGGAGSPFADWLAENGEGLHHISYEVTDIAGELKKLAGLGVALQDKEPREIPGGVKIAFVGPEGSSGVVIELVERP